MRIRRALATTALGTALVLGGSIAPALAAPSATTTAGTVASNRAAQGEETASIAAGVYHYWGTYNSLGACIVAGANVIQSNPSRYLNAKCTPFGNKQKLWIEI
ncbi:hypothetical protein OG618_00380 [Kitasatospora sp. NBC_01246]|uniref:hypothetical protein n=1 Tax=Kitasatospora sp. NBC_01246 TaxID=2903570 RepID=UPI002E2F1675|nr:hypothetical protein [Kitasatospora sp. NBC_01246]